jgi:hypothetical protein
MLYVRKYVCFSRYFTQRTTLNHDISIFRYLWSLLTTAGDSWKCTEYNGVVMLTVIELGRLQILKVIYVSLMTKSFT